MKSKAKTLTITALLAISAITPIALAADNTPSHPLTPGQIGSPGQIAFQNGTHLLNGRYSFRAQGTLTDAPSVYAPSGPVARVGTIVFDGVGHVDATLFYETVSGDSFKVGGPGGD